MILKTGEKGNKNDIELAIILNPDLHEMCMENNPEKAWDKLIKASNDIYNEYAPIKVMQRRANFQPYITDEICDIEK